MRERKFEKSHIHFLQTETLSRESRVTESTKEIVNFIPYNCVRYTSCQHLYTLCGKERRRERMMSICLTWFPIGGLGEPNI